MNTMACFGRRRVLPVCLLLTLIAPAAFALSRSLPAPDVNFPQGYDKARAAQIISVLSNPKLKYADGIVSYWPPEWGTRLVYDGDADALNALLADLRRVKGLTVTLAFTRGPVATMRDSPSYPWEVNYAQNDPDRLSIVVSLTSARMDIEKLHLPAWKDGP